MEKDDLKSKTNERLNSELKGLKVITGALVVVLSLLFAITIYGVLTKEDNTVFIALMAVAISLSAMIPINYAKIKGINKELKLRKNNQG
ncbi:hypothetical protein [Aquimarina sp. AU474]|uniref:hypothetical protein n=1 Tax=Aquimarina sp. AU474 TaxID=2108529 RepID=UPI000D685943|nr:hypothetical protein [Aquimarina sp. AU474]